MRKLWMRVGMSLNITEEEEKIIFSEDGVAGAETIKKIIAEGRAELDGDTYSPGGAVEDYNKQYGTSYEEDDIGWDL